MQKLKGVSVLVVEDDGPSRRLVTLLLENAGAAVVSVSSAEEALECMNQNTPDCVIIDVILPKASGLALADELKANPAWSKVVLVAVTSLNTAEVAKIARDAGCSVLLQKPIDTESFVATVAAQLGR